jgi:DNA-binding transcriptional LysR family regulator
MTRAAARLHLSQQALSMSMRALERELGVPLLDRSRRGVALLASGEALYADAVPLLAAATAAVGRARRADRGEPELLRIGHTPAVTGIEVTEMLAGAPAYGACVQVVALLADELGERLRDRSVDVGLSRAMAPPAGLAGQVVARHRLRLAVRAGHRLAHRHAVTFPEIAAETLIVGAPPGVCAYTDLLLGLCRRAGFEPRHRVTPVQGTPPVTTVLGNDGAALVTEPPGPAVGGAVQVVELEPETTVPVLASWRGDTRSTLRDVLVAGLAS